MAQTMTVGQAARASGLTPRAIRLYTMADLQALRSSLAAVRRDARTAIREGRRAVVCTIIESAATQRAVSQPTGR